MKFTVSVVSGTPTAIDLLVTKQLDLGIGYTHWSTWPYNTDGTGDPSTDSFSTGWSRAAIANQYRTNDNFNVSDDTTFTLSLPAQAVTDLAAAIAGAGIWTLCQGLDSGSSYGNQLLGMYSQLASNSAYRPTLRITYTPAASGQPTRRRYGGIRHMTPILGAEGVGVF